MDAFKANKDYQIDQDIQALEQLNRERAEKGLPEVGWSQYCGPTSITYTANPDNCREVLDFIGPQPACPVCGGYGEYESEYGPKGCNPCNSRLIAFVNAEDKTVYADWGDTIERRYGSLHLVAKPETGHFLKDGTPEETLAFLRGESPKVFNPLEHGISNQPLMVPAHEYNKLKGALESAEKARDAAIHNQNAFYAQLKISQANAELIAEAFNVTHETGLTPRELVEKLSELKSFLKHFEPGAPWKPVERTTQARALLETLAKIPE